MRPLSILLPILSAAAIAAAAPSALAQQPGPDSQPQPGVPKGEVLHFTFDHSKIFPGTFRDYWVYVPAEYKGDRPACLFVNQDGVGWNAPTVFDNLIYKKEMPVTIGVFVMHGRVRPKDEKTALDRFNRSLEYDGLSDRYARFLVDELLPEVETKKATDGRPIRISHDPKDRAIGGGSSGAVCAFTAAWERPDQFSRVFSAIGTYVGLRGADRYPTLIRKYEPKRLRVYLQDGSNDQNIYAGDWWMANQMMERALKFGGYEVEHTWGEGGHSGQQGTAIFPDVMRWLWKGWPEPVAVGHSGNAFLHDMLVDGEGWQPVGEGYGAASALAVNRSGEAYFSDPSAGRTYKFSGAAPSVFLPSNRKATGQAFGPDGYLYTTSADGKLQEYDASGKARTVASGIRGTDLVVASSGNIYVTEPGKVWLVRKDGRKSVADTGIAAASGITLSPDQTLLYVADQNSHWVYCYQIQPDGTLQAKQQYDWLHVPDDREDADARGMCVDRDGRLYVATSMGLQVCDQAGRVNCILPVPGGAVSSVAIGGPNNDLLLATAGGHVYRRKIAVKGAHAWDSPNKPAAPRL